MKFSDMNECTYKKPTITFKHILLFLLCATLCVSVQSIWKSMSMIQAQLHYNEYLIKLEQQKNSEGFESLKKINPNFIAWIKIEDVDLSLPIVSTSTKSEEDFYLKHGFDKKNNKRGCPYQTSECDINSNYSLIIGHSSYTLSLFGNETNISLFGKLNSYINKSGNYNYRITLETETELRNYQIVGYFCFDISNKTSDKYNEIYNNIYNVRSLDTEEKFNNFKSTLTKNAFLNLGEELNFGDRILTLFTCHTNLNYRTIVVAKQV